jgi:hypothetical protein
LRVIYDTNILLQLLRNADSMERLQAKLGFHYLEDFISIVTVAEIRSLAIQFNWGNTWLPDTSTSKPCRSSPQILIPTPIRGAVNKSNRFTI